MGFVAKTVVLPLLVDGTYRNCIRCDNEDTFIAERARFAMRVSGSGKHPKVEFEAIDDSLSSHVSTEEIDSRTATGQKRLASHLEAEQVIAAVETILKHVDENQILDAADDIESDQESADIER